MKEKGSASLNINTSEGSAPYIESLYESYLDNPQSVPEDWRIYFETLPSEPSDTKEISHKEIIQRFKSQRRRRPHSSISPGNDKQIRVIQLIQAYRNRGHQRANLDPLGLKEIKPCEDLDLEFHGLDENDLNKKFKTDTLKINGDTATLSEIVCLLYTSPSPRDP